MFVCHAPSDSFPTHPPPVILNQENAGPATTALTAARKVPTPLKAVQAAARASANANNSGSNLMEALEAASEAKCIVNENGGDAKDDKGEAGGNQTAATGLNSSFVMPDELGSPRRVKGRHSTSTLQIRDTVAKPNVGKLLLCLAVAISEEAEAGDVVADSSLYTVDSWPAFECADLCAPAHIGTVADFICDLYGELELSIECLVVSWMYLRRLVDGGVALNHKNWPCVFITTTLVAAKVWNDPRVNNRVFADAVAGLSTGALQGMEIELLRRIAHDTSIRTADYVSAYFVLCDFDPTAAEEAAANIAANTAAASADPSALPRSPDRESPLTAREAARLELRSEAFGLAAGTSRRRKTQSEGADELATGGRDFAIIS